jgi:1-acyl-sn-glycerol-3-phosphate acyltransferase
MSGSPKVVPIRRLPPRVRPGTAAVRSQLRVLENELHRIESAPADTRGHGVPAALSNLLQEAIRSIRWDNAAQALAALYFSWHSEEVDEFGYDRRFTETIRPLLEFLYTVWWRVDATGLDHVPGRGQALVVGNHAGVLPWDGLMVNLALRHAHPGGRECRLLALDMFALLPFLAPLLSRIGAVRANPENGERLLNKGEVVGVFPEGVKGVGKYFRDRYKLARFGRGGFVRVALRTGAPIVPCAIVGSEEVHPMLGTANWVGRPFGLPYFPITPTFPWLGPAGVIPLPSKWTIEFAPPMAMDRYGPEAAEDPILVNRLSEQVRQTIQEMINSRLATRESVWFG